MKTVIFEIAEWEKELLQKNLQDAVFTEDELNSGNAGSFADMEIISTFISSNINKDIIDKLPNLKLIVTRSTGFDHIDLDYCRSKNIAVSNVPEYGSSTVAEHTFALLLNLTRKIPQAIEQIQRLNFDHSQLIGIDLCDKTIGIIGLGKIGQHVLRIAQGFGMKVISFARHPDEELAKRLNFEYKDLDTLLGQSDVVTLHLPLTTETKHIINKDNISKFKKGAYLINTARGGLIDVEAILLGLDQGILSGVGLDVLEEEDELHEEVSILTRSSQQNINFKTLLYDHILIKHPKVIVTPHNAFNSKEALKRIIQVTIENIQSFINGKAINTV
ncbi:MAG: hydroxyacid dehydrogenase [Candidatus Levybacteria bacterium]|nr:hydroxyacid dehydrogenase [Candidatus Levybacteria bacterium]